MNKLLGVAILGAALGLSACGGDSDSSGDSPSVNPTNPPVPPATTIKTCPSTGTSPVKVNIPNNSSCTFSIPNLNKGNAETYKCTNGTLTTPLGTSGGSTTFGNYEISCVL